MESFDFNKWVTPTSVLALLGGVVWGVQLNYAVVSHTEALGQLKGRMQNNEQLDYEQNEQLARIAIILEQLEKRISIIEDK